MKDEKTTHKHKADSRSNLLDLLTDLFKDEEEIKIKEHGQENPNYLRLKLILDNFVENSIRLVFSIPILSEMESIPIKRLRLFLLEILLHHPFKMEEQFGITLLKGDNLDELETALAEQKSSYFDEKASLLHQILQLKSDYGELRNKSLGLEMRQTSLNSENDGLRRQLATAKTESEGLRSKYEGIKAQLLEVSLIAGILQNDEQTEREKVITNLLNAVLAGKPLDSSVIEKKLALATRKDRRTKSNKSTRREIKK